MVLFSQFLNCLTIFWYKFYKLMTVLNYVIENPTITTFVFMLDPYVFLISYYVFVEGHKKV